MKNKKQICIKKEISDQFISISTYCDKIIKKDNIVYNESDFQL